MVAILEMFLPEKEKDRNKDGKEETIKQEREKKCITY